MNRENAKAWLTRATAATSEPPLSSTELDALLDRATGGAALISFRQLDSAAAMGWAWKSDATAEYHTEGEQRIHEHCVERQKFYARRAAGAPAKASTPDPDSVKALL